MFGHMRLLQNFPVSQVVGCTLLVGNSSISLSGGEESPKMLKMASESFTDVVVGFRPFSQNFPLGAPVFCVCCVIQSYLLFMF